MSYPQQQAPWPPQQFQDPYASQQPGYPPQGYQQPPAQYPPQQFAPQGFQQPYGQPPAQQPQLAAGSLDQFFSQPSAGGGAALKFQPPPGPGQPGTVHVGIVARPISNGDIQQQTQPGSGLPAFYKDGRPKFVMKVPLQVAPSQTHPDGLAQWYVAGGARDELVRAMSAAGAPDGPPEEGAAIRIECTGTRNAGPGMNPAKTYSVQYQRPGGATPAQPPAQTPPPQQQQGAVPSNGGPGSAGTDSFLPPQAPPAQPPAQPPAPPQQQQQQQQAAPPAAPTAAANPEFSPQQNELLARLTGGAPAAT